MREFGLTGMYRGAAACWLRDAPFSAIYFGIYHQVKEILRSNDGQVNLFSLFIAGSVAGTCAAAFSTPADVIKTRMQIKSSNRVGIIKCARDIVINEGYSALLKGSIPRVLRSSPQYATMLVAYEILLPLIPGSSVNNSTWSDYLTIEDRYGMLLDETWSPPGSFVKTIATDFQRVSIGSRGSIWGVKSDGSVYRWNEIDWQPIRGPPMLHVSAGADSIWATDYEGKAFEWNENLQNWQSHQSPKLTYLSCGSSTNIWAISTDNQVIRRNSKGIWSFVGDLQLSQVSVGVDGSAWGISPDGAIFEWDELRNQWQARPGVGIRQLSVGSHLNVRAVNSNGQVLKWNGLRWIPVDNSGRWASAAADGSVAVIESPNKQIK